MSNQLLSWAIFVVPWLTLVFMKKEDIRRYMPVALLAIVLTTIIHDVGIRFGFWVVEEAAYPMAEMLPYFYGLIPVLTMWIFRFTNGHILAYVITNIILDIGFVYSLLGSIFPARGIYALVGITRFQVLLINLVHFTLLYIYQKWQEGELVPVMKNLLSPAPQSAAAKPLVRDKDNRNDNKW